MNIQMKMQEYHTNLSKIQADQELSDNKRQKQIRNLNNDLVGFIRENNLSDEELKEVVKFVSDDQTKYLVIQKMSSDIAQKECLQYFDQNDYIFRTVKNFKDDELKKECLPSIKEDAQRANIIRGFEDDKLKKEALQSIEDEEYRADIIRGFEDDGLKEECLDFLFTDEWKSSVIQSFKSDALKEKYLPTIKDKKCRLEIVFSFQETTKINDYYNANEAERTEIVLELSKRICQQSKNIEVLGKLWYLMNSLNIGYLCIPYILSHTKYEIIQDLDDNMKLDVEFAIGKKLPEDLNELSPFEKVGVDFSALQGTVVSNKEQFPTTELQKKYFNAIRASANGPKKIAMKDFIGTINANLKYGIQVDTIKTWEDLCLNLQRMEFNLQRHSEEFLFDADRNNSVKLYGVNGKFVVFGNGNHTMTLLKAKYLTEMQRANGDIEKQKEIDRKYTVMVETAKEPPLDREELELILELYDLNLRLADGSYITEYIEEGKKAGYILGNNDDNRIVIKSKDELKSVIESRRKLIDAKMQSEQQNGITSPNIEHVTPVENHKVGDLPDVELIPEDTSGEKTKSVKKWMEILRKFYERPLVKEELKIKIVKIRNEFKESIIQLFNNTLNKLVDREK